METLRQRLEEQKARHQGGNRWIGTGGTSPFGNAGYNPEGVRIGGEGGNRRAVKVWDRREFANLDDSVELGTRNIKLALRRLRRFARQGAADTLDLDATIESTARRAGLLDIRMVPERHNAVKVLLFLDIGGSMDDHVRICEELFSAARGEFKHLEHFYFHNFVYESVWKDNRRRHGERTPLPQVLRTYGPDYRLVFVGDATMSPYEILQPGGSIEHWNEEAGRGLDEAAARELPAPRLAQPGAAGPLGVHALDPHHARAGRGPDVPADARGARPRDEKPAIRSRRQWHSKTSLRQRAARSRAALAVWRQRYGQAPFRVSFLNRGSARAPEPDRSHGVYQARVRFAPRSNCRCWERRR